MARSEEDWQTEMRMALRHEDWALAGPKRIVKVVAAGRAVAPELDGYVCLEKVLVGKTPHQIERLLGLPSNLLRAGCRV